ncbi:MAG: DNA-3-methyladenine glycosylase I [Bacteroidetes bacterium]|nr:MAG: DNA-3-methyladenine glycosylase I [Bacteroidota bacterium]
MDAIEHRCSWCTGSELYQHYHDFEWGRPVRDEQKMFEFLTLETFQAGLSWITILKKRENFREAFHQFNIKKIAAMNEQDIDTLMNNVGIIRNRKKIEAAIHNAQILLRLHQKGTTLVDTLWAYMDNTPLDNQRKHLGEVPALTPLATQISKDLKAIGFKFLGPTTTYAHMQACGMVNDHLVSCPFHKDCLE